MGRTPLQTAVLLALFSAAPALQAETTAPGTAAAPVEATTSTVAAPNTPEVAAATAPAPATENTAAPSAPTTNTPETVTASTTESKGDTLALPKEASKPAKKKVTRAPVKVEVDGMPGRGATMAEVEKHFGKPKQKLAPVGKPPITRWIYDHYTVYFEHQYVIHSVKNEEKTVPAETKSAAPAAPTTQPPATPANASAPQPAAEPVATDAATPAPEAPVEPATDAATPASQTPAEPSADAATPAPQEPAGATPAPKE